MPPELPGFYWNESKNRYFPLASKPKTYHADTPAAQPPSESSNSTTIANLKQTHWKSERLRRETSFRYRRERASHDILCSHFASTSSVEQINVPVYGSITSFCTTSLHGQPYSFVGDNRGWLYSTAPDDVHIWGAELNLQPSSEISSICIAGSRCIATSCGQSTKIAVKDLNVSGRISILNLRGIHDAWTSHLQGSALVLGANKKAVYLPDIDVIPSIRNLYTSSDVFAVQQRHNMIYAGTRSGSIMRFDMRMDTPHCQKLFEKRFESKPRSSVLYINTVKDSQLLISHMNGDLGTFDLRFSRGDIPVMSFPGHVNSLTRNLGIAVDPSEEFVFAAGEDYRIRGWSLRTGYPLHDPSHSSAMSTDSISQANHQSNPFRTVFDHPVTTMQVVDERQGLALWAGSDGCLYRYHLGQR